MLYVTYIMIKRQAVTMVFQVTKLDTKLSGVGIRLDNQRNRVQARMIVTRLTLKQTIQVRSG